MFFKKKPRAPTSPKAQKLDYRLDCRDVEIIAPHFKRRPSGVTASMRTLIPAQLAAGSKIAVIGPGLPANMPRLKWQTIFALWQKPRAKPFRIWHARRNTEILAGLFLRDVLRMPLRVIFTFAKAKKPDPYKRWLLRKCDRIIATSRHNSAYLQFKHHIVLHGIDITKFSPAEDKDKAWQQAKLPGRYAIGCFGRIKPNKGSAIFVDSMIELLALYPDWTALIIGRTTLPYLPFLYYLRSRVKKAGLSDRILFFHETKDIVRSYRLLSLFVTASKSEGFGLTPLEAMACGVPAIVSNSGVWPEVITDQTGRLLEQASASNFTKALKPFLENPQSCQIMGQKARRHIAENFSSAKEVEHLANIYNNLWQEGA